MELSMEYQTLFNLVITLSGVLGGWMLNTIWSAINDLKKDVKDINKQIHSDFVRKDIYNGDIADIKNMLGKIFDKLDKKVDKN
jgi:uncharacterized coiled-coil DUF342 family protein